MGPQCPIAFCDIVGKEEARNQHVPYQESKCNRIEADKIVIYIILCVPIVNVSVYFQVDIIVALKMAKRSNRNDPNIAVLTPYKAQKELMKNVVSHKKLGVTVSTINESQGYKYIK